MGYNIEVSFNTIKNPNVTEYEQEIIKIAENMDCNGFYKLYDFEKNLSPDRNHIIINVNFDNTTQFTQFIKKIKKIKGIYIEIIYNDSLKTDILYASPYYLTTMDKYLSKTYKKNRRERSYSEDETIILDEMKKK